MAKNKKKSKGNGTGQNQPTPKNTAPSKTAPLASKKKVTSDIKLGILVVEVKVYGVFDIFRLFKTIISGSFISEELKYLGAAN